MPSSPFPQGIQKSARVMKERRELRARTRVARLNMYTSKAGTMRRYIVQEDEQARFTGLASHLTLINSLIWLSLPLTMTDIRLRSLLNSIVFKSSRVSFLPCTMISICVAVRLTNTYLCHRVGFTTHDSRNEYEVACIVSEIRFYLNKRASRKDGMNEACLGGSPEVPCRPCQS